MGRCSERIDLDADNKLIQRLILGRKRVARLLSQDQPPEEQLSAEEDDGEKKSN